MENMIKIENFGSVSKTEIDISKSAILVGPNGSGKSFTTLIIHTFLNPLNENNKEQYNYLFKLGIESLGLLLDSNTDLLEEYNNDLIKHNNLSKKYPSDPFKIPKDVFNKLIMEGVGKEYLQIIDNRLKTIFNVDNLDDLIKYDKNFFKITYNNITLIKYRNKPFKLEKFNINFRKKLNTQEIRLILDKSEFVINETDDCYELYLNYLLLNDNANNIFRYIYSRISEEVLEKLINEKSYYIPSARDELIKDKNSFISKNLSGINNITNIQNSLLSNLLNIDKNSKNKDFYGLGTNMEYEILNGEISILDDESIIDFTFNDPEYNITLPLNLVSSGARELSPFILYLKYILKKGDTIIIEEPEAHLYPMQQVILANYFANAINLGLNIIITTHSDFLVNQFNNNIRLNNISEDVLKEKIKNYNKYYALDYSKINIYNFEFIEKYNSISEKVEINDTGFDEITFSDVAESQYEELVNILEMNR